MKIASTFMMYYFNITGVLSVKSHNYELKLSKRWLLYNFLNIFLMTAAKCTLPSWVLSKNLRQEPDNVDGITTFLTSMLSIVRLRLIVTAPVFFCVSIWKLKQIISFIEACKRIFYLFELSSSSELWKQLRHKCYKSFFLLLLSSFFMKLIYFLSIFQTTWQAAFFYFIFHWHNNIVYNFIVFVSLFFPYFLLLLHILYTEIEHANELGLNNPLDYNLLASKFLELHQLIAKFNKAFGPLLSITAEFVFFAITFCVSLR